MAHYLIERLEDTKSLMRPCLSFGIPPQYFFESFFESMTTEIQHVYTAFFNELVSA